MPTKIHPSRPSFLPRLARRTRAPLLLALAATLPSVALAQGGAVVLHCPTVGIGGDNANFRGVRFQVSQTFTAVEVHIDGSQPGVYAFDVELRRSTGYVGPLEATSFASPALVGSPGSTPYQAVRIDFPQPVVVTGGPETFTLKALNISGPGAMYWEVAGIGNIPCPDAEVTNENNVATPTMRTSACGLRVLDASGPTTLGTNYCSASPNSTGMTGVIAATGSARVLDNDVTLSVSDVPASAFLFFLVSSTQAQTNNPGGSQGNLCLGGAIGRYVGPGQIQMTDPAGTASLAIDLDLLPQPSGIIMVAPGETWNFQAWHRDTNMGAATSNFTDATEVLFL